MEKLWLCKISVQRFAFCGYTNQQVCPCRSTCFEPADYSKIQGKKMSVTHFIQLLIKALKYYHDYPRFTNTKSAFHLPASQIIPSLLS